MANINRVATGVEKLLLVVLTALILTGGALGGWALWAPAYEMLFPSGAAPAGASFGVQFWYGFGSAMELFGPLAGVLAGVVLIQLGIRRWWP